mmetsp:Transcript_25011/g.71933  ORF Transcript_25011/g.71933 Transcript_25011/m.71933 type:complete len:286 (-) Transcript_25011:3199-4056(-)
MHRAGQRHVALVRQGRHNESRRIPEVLVGVLKARDGLPANAVVRHVIAQGCLRGLGVLRDPVVPQLLAPIELVRGPDISLDQVLQDCNAVHIEHDQGAHQHPLQLRELHPHDRHRVLQLPLVKVDVLLHGVRVRARGDGDQSFLSELGPHDLVDQQLRLRREGAVEQPLGALRPILGIRLQGALRRIVQAVDHGDLDLCKPFLYDGTRHDRLDEGHLLLDHVGHGDDVRLFRGAELHPVDRVEALAHVLLHRMWVARLRQDAEQLVVGQEVESRECCTLCLEVSL